MTMLSDIRIEFCCPVCGGRDFRTDLARNEGRCSGEATKDRHVPCKFTWPRADDWRCFVLVEVNTFESADDYRNAQRALDEEEEFQEEAH